MAEAPPPDEAQFVAIWEALCEGRLPAPIADGGSAAAGPAGAGAEGSALTVAARHEKYVKGKLSVAADHFNRDYKKGFQYLQVQRLDLLCLLHLVPLSFGSPCYAERRQRCISTP